MPELSNNELAERLEGLAAQVVMRSCEPGNEYQRYRVNEDYCKAKMEFASAALNALPQIIAALRPGDEVVEKLAWAIAEACKPYSNFKEPIGVPRWSSMQMGIWKDIARATLGAISAMPIPGERAIVARFLIAKAAAMTVDPVTGDYEAGMQAGVRMAAEAISRGDHLTQGNPTNAG